jgi:hypothetical protein
MLFILRNLISCSDRTSLLNLSCSTCFSPRSWQLCPRHGLPPRLRPSPCPPPPPHTLPGLLLISRRFREAASFSSIMPCPRAARCNAPERRRRERQDPEDRGRRTRHSRHSSRRKWSDRSQRRGTAGWRACQTGKESWCTEAMEERGQGRAPRACRQGV